MLSILVYHRRGSYRRGLRRYFINDWAVWKDSFRIRLNKPKWKTIYCINIESNIRAFKAVADADAKPSPRPDDLQPSNWCHSAALFACAIRTGCDVILRINPWVSTLHIIKIASQLKYIFQHKRATYRENFEGNFMNRLPIKQLCVLNWRKRQCKHTNIQQILTGLNMQNRFA